ncbi:ATP-binding cassette domain-containing protein [Corticibacter populi]|uniref:Probable ATP-binding protein YheS n=1 Tax=Corticibacter populi TaxID=1550736 RepID=A0A3M6QYJ7_9BURK|nr:ATP-binding cassette domain-containing protein [Corticibacter populi]RMX07689.1 ATP-binding cassette domain-containing protein [Corticibacter populi]RZS30200.1 ATP-binding cassette subfamily F protein 3 [Corticibacter populi]
MITLKNIVLRRGAKVLLEGTSVTINPGEHVALVGRNGAGKSSLFALLNGNLHEDGGEFSIPRHWHMAQVAQNMPETEESATDFVVAGDARLVALQAALQEADASGDGMAIAQAHTELADAGAYDAQARAQALILGLGFAPDELERPVNSFSGGWRMRLQLARALMAPSDLLLLDEPTNHLDLDALVWLEGWLARYPGTLVVISHDREFLDAVTQVTLHLEHQGLTRYGGNYSYFEEQRALKLEQQQAAYSRQQGQIAHLQKFIDRFKAKATKAKQAQSRVKALERMERIAPVLAEAEFSFEFEEPLQLPNPMLAIRDAEMGYQSKDGSTRKTILRGVNASILAGQRIGILGANGQGKSTFIKSVVGDIPLLSGEITQGKGLAIGYFAQQELDVLREDENPLQHFMHMARQYGTEAPNATREQDLRNFLGRFQFSGDMMAQPVGSMSGGEKARLVLAMLVWQRPNLLLLDEPTNHLDLVTREALGMALNGFDGTLMLVSHDRALLRAVSDDFWLVSEGRVRPFDGDLEDYQQYVLEQQRRQRAELAKSAQSAPLTQRVAQSDDAAPVAGSGAAPNQKELRRQEAQARQKLLEQTRPLKKRLEQLEKQLAASQADKLALEQELAGGGASAQQWAEQGRKLKQLQDDIDAAEEEWLTVSETLQALAPPDA